MFELIWWSFQKRVLWWFDIHWIFRENVSHCVLPLLTVCRWSRCWIWGWRPWYWPVTWPRTQGSVDHPGGYSSWRTTPNWDSTSQLTVPVSSRAVLYQAFTVFSFFFFLQDFHAHDVLLRNIEINAAIVYQMCVFMLKYFY